MTLKCELRVDSALLPPQTQRAAVGLVCTPQGMFPEPTGVAAWGHGALRISVALPTTWYRS